MGRAEADKAVAAGEPIDLERIDGRPFRALVYDAMQPLTATEHGMGLLVALAQEMLFSKVIEGFSERVLQLRKN